MASEPFVDQMRRGSVHVNASQKTFKNIYARFHTFYRMGAFSVLLVNDSEYTQSTGAKPIFRSLLAVFISFPLARCAPLPTPPPLFGGGKVPKKTKKKKIVGVGEGSEMG